MMCDSGCFVVFLQRSEDCIENSARNRIVDVPGSRM